MARRALLAALVAMVSWTAQAEHAIAPEAESLADSTREVCTTLIGYDVIRTNCRVQALAAQEPNEALKGICTTYYGRRTCH
jgi:hypothetical protein